MAYPPVVGPASGPKEAVRAYARAVDAQRLDQVDEFIDETYALGSQVGFDPFLICVQSAHETGDPNDGRGWHSEVWVERLNPGGLGVTDSVDYGYGFANGRDAARAMLVHHAAYVFGSLPGQLKPYVDLDSRYQDVFDEGFARTVTSWGDYGHGRWATDPTYADQIVDKAEIIRSFGTNESEASTNEKEEETMPNIVDWWLNEDRTVDGVYFPGVVRYYANRSGYQPQAIFLHIQEGSNFGSWQHFHNVTASATVFVGKNGDIWRLVRESDAPWTNGDVCNATPKGTALMNEYGWDPNYYTLSIETEGFASEWPKRQEQLDSVVWQIKQWMKKYDIPKSRVFRHADVNQCSRAGCPGDAYYNYVMAQLDDNEVPEYAKPSRVLVNGQTWDGAVDVVINNATFYAEARTVYASAGGAVCRQYASTNAAMTRSVVPPGKGFGVLGWVHGDEVDGENRWWITKHYSRVHVSGTVQKPTERKPTPTPMPEKPNDKVEDGKLFHAIRADGKPVVVKTGEGTVNPRKWASVTAPSTHEPLKSHDGFSAVYWVKGELVDEEHGNDVWLITAHGSRIFSGETDFDWRAAKEGKVWDSDEA